MHVEIVLDGQVVIALKTHKFTFEFRIHGHRIFQNKINIVCTIDHIRLECRMLHK